MKAQTLRDYLEEKTNGRTVDRYGDSIFSSEAFKPLRETLNSLDKLTQEMFSAHTKKETSMTVSKFFLYPENSGSDDDFFRLAKEFYLDQGFEQMSHEIYGDIYSKENEHVILTLNTVFDRVCITEKRVTVLEPVDMIGYETLDNYLGEDYPQGLKSVAKEIFDLGESTLDYPDPATYYHAFISITVSILTQLRNHEQEELVYKVECPPEINPIAFESFLDNATPIIMRTSQSMLKIEQDNSDYITYSYCEKLIGAYFLAVSDDIQDYEKVHVDYKRMLKAKSN